MDAEVAEAGTKVGKALAISLGVRHQNELIYQMGHEDAQRHGEAEGTARQQTQGEIQLPLSDCGVVALDYRGKKGIATAIGHAPQAGLADPAAGSVLSVAESLTNLVWAPLANGLDTVSLSANWMWPCRSQKGEDARLYEGVKALSDFCCAIHVNVPTGKDSLSLTQQDPNGEKIIAPGTVIVSAGGEVSDIKKVVSPVLVNDKN